MKWNQSLINKSVDEEEPGVLLTKVWEYNTIITVEPNENTRQTSTIYVKYKKKGIKTDWLGMFHWICKKWDIAGLWLPF